MLDSRYQVVRKLAEGGMAEILLADLAGDEGLVRRVVVKRILAEFSNDPAFKAMFLNEAKLVSKFHHPNVVEILDFGIDDGRYFITMEYVDGFHLGALNKRCAMLGRVVPYELAAKMVAQACAGLGYAHGYSEEGQPLKLIHRDISPENLLINRSGVVKVADFGIAKIEGQVRTTRAGTVKGKLLYMAPEQFKGDPIDHRADIFALGIVLYELCTGKRPFIGEHDGAAMQAMLVGRATPMVHFRPDAPPALQQIIDRALAHEPADRYQSCAEFQQALEKFSSKASPQALAVFVADLAPSELVTEPRPPIEPLPTGVGLPTGTLIGLPPPPAPAPVPLTVPVADWAVAPTAPTPAPPPAAVVPVPPPPAVVAPAPAVHAPLPSLYAPVPAAPAAVDTSRTAIVPPPVFAKPAEVKAPLPSLYPAPSQPAETSFELEAKAFGRTKREIPKPVLIGAGVLLLVLVSFGIGRMGASPEPAPAPEKAKAEAAPEVAPPAPEPEEPKVVAEAKPKAEVKPEPKPKVEPEPTAKAEPKPKSEPKAKAEPKAKPKAEPRPKRGRNETASASATATASSPDEWAAPPAPASKGLAGRVTQRANGYVLANDTDFAWHGCHLRFPNAKAYVVPAPLAPRKQLSVAFTFLQNDAEPTDAYVLQGFAQVRCQEGAKYLPIGN